jgi:hypothetical protein
MSRFEVLSQTLEDCAKDTKIPPPFGWIISRSGATQEERRKAWSQLFVANYLVPLTQAILRTPDSASNRQARVVGLVKFDEFLLTNAPPVLTDNDPFPKAFLGAFTDAEPQALDDNARLLVRASKAKLISTTWYAPVQKDLWTRAGNAFDGLIGDKTIDLKNVSEFVESARRQASADQAFVMAQDRFEGVAEKVDPNRMSSSDLQNLRTAFNDWATNRPGTRTHVSLAGAGEEAARRLDGSFGQSFKSLQDDLAAVKVGTLAPQFLKEINDFRTNEVSRLNERWGQLNRDFRNALAEISAASQKGEQILPAVAASLVLFGPEYAPAPESPFAGWNKFEKERDEMVRRSPAVSNELGRILLLAGAYQRSRAAGGAGNLARQTEEELNRWPLANSASRIPEDQFSGAVARAKARLADPNGLGHPDSRSSVSNLTRLIGIADQLRNKEKLELKFLILESKQQPSIAFRALRVGDKSTEFGNNGDTVSRTLQVGSVNFTARYSEGSEKSGSIVGRWRFLELFWDAQKSAFRTNETVALPVEGGLSVKIKVLGANWVE